MRLSWTTRTVEQKGLELPWKKMVFKAGRNRTVGQGSVFITEEALREVAERREEDYLYSPPLIDLDDIELLALQQHKLAEIQPHRGYYGTDRLRGFLKGPGGAR